MPRNFLRSIGAIVIALSSAAAGRADIAVFNDGRTLKISGYQVEDDTVSLSLPSGGHVVLPLERIERILDDEVVPQPEIAKLESLFPSRTWRFDENRKPLFGTKYDEMITDVARKFDVDAVLVSAVIKAESDYNPKIVSHKGARGLMQLMPGTARRFGVGDSFNPVQNVHGGTRYLRWLLEKFDGNAELAVAAYNAGEGNVWKYDGVPPFRETVNYVKKIAKHVSRAEAGAATLGTSVAAR